MGGFGWGSVLRPTGATLYNSFGLSKVTHETEDFVAKNKYIEDFCTLCIMKADVKRKADMK
jgi:hypothetical protein